MRQMLAAAGAPDYVLEAIRPGANLTEILAEAQSRTEQPAVQDLLVEACEALRPALAGKGNPFLAEATVLEMLAVLDVGVVGADVFAESPSFPAAVVELIGLAEQAATRQALAVLRTLAVHGPQASRSPATAAADSLVAAGVAEPPFTGVLGRPTPHECFAYRDIFGHQAAIALTFGYGRRKHAVCVLIDHDLGGGVKDCWVTDQAAEIRKKYRSMGGEAMAVFEDLSFADGLTRLQAALAADPCPEQLDQMRDTKTYLPILRQRVALVAESVAAGPA